jgi:LmbE family N-acetylglucosaminyl deacetylase
MLEIANAHPDCDVRWVVLSSDEERGREARASAGAFLEGFSRKSVTVESFDDGFFPYQGAEIKRFFEKELKPFDPDFIFTHRRDDRHQDHRLVSDLTWNTFRDHMILEYEIMKYDGDLGPCNVYVPIAADTASRKAVSLMRHFGTQASKHWFDQEAFLSIMRIRGVEGRSDSGYAEAFSAKKLVWSIK